MNIIIDADKISIISALIAFVSMIIALFSMFSSWSQASIAKKNYNARKPNFTFKILEDFCINNIGENNVHIRFLIHLINLSDRTMTIGEICLKIRGESNELIILPKIADNLLCAGYNITGNQSLKKWSQFDLSRHQYTALDILDYTIEIKDSYGNIQTELTTYLQEKTE